MDNHLWRKGLPQPFLAVRRRDLTVLDLPGGDRLVIACDAAGGIGPKEQDRVRVPGYVLGRFTARVALMEVVAGGGQPVVLVNTCSVEPEPTGREIMRGVLDEAALAGLDRDAVTGSFEKNVTTVQTGIGVTAVALANGPLRNAAPGDLVVAVGRPKVGNEVSLDDPDIVDLTAVIRLSRDAAIHDLLPVGSRGIAAEVLDLASAAGLVPELLPPEPGWDLEKSAGPSTCCLVAVAPLAFPALALTLTQPWAVVACLQ